MLRELRGGQEGCASAGADETDLTGMAPHVRHPRLTAASAAQHDGLRVGAAS